MNTTVITQAIADKINHLHNLPEDALEAAAAQIGSNATYGGLVSDEVRNRFYEAGANDDDVTFFEEDIQEAMFCAADLITDVINMAREQRNNATK